MDKDEFEAELDKRTYWQGVTSNITSVMSGRWTFITVWGADDIQLEGSFSLSDLETIIRIVKDAKTP